MNAHKSSKAICKEHSRITNRGVVIEDAEIAVAIGPWHRRGPKVILLHNKTIKIAYKIINIMLYLVTGNSPKI